MSLHVHFHSNFEPSIPVEAKLCHTDFAKTLGNNGLVLLVIALLGHALFAPDLAPLFARLSALSRDGLTDGCCPLLVDGVILGQKGWGLVESSRVQARKRTNAYLHERSVLVLFNRSIHGLSWSWRVTTHQIHASCVDHLEEFVNHFVELRHESIDHLDLMAPLWVSCPVMMEEVMRMRANRREHYEFSDVWRKLCNSPAKDFKILLTAVAAELVGVSGDSTRRDQTRWREGASVRETYVDNEERTAHDSTYHPDKTEREGYHLDCFAPTVFFAVSFACCQCAFVGSVDCES